MVAEHEKAFEDSEELSERRSAWGRALLTELTRSARAAEDEGLFASPAAIHYGLLKTALLNLLCCCDLPEDIPLCIDMVESTFNEALDDVLYRHPKSMH